MNDSRKLEKESGCAFTHAHVYDLGSKRAAALFPGLKDADLYKHV